MENSIESQNYLKVNAEERQLKIGHFVFQSLNKPISPKTTHDAEQQSTLANGFEDTWKNERKKTTEEELLISFANQITNKALRESGAQDSFFPSKDVHIVSTQEWSDPTSKSGVFAQESQSITLVDTFKSRLSFMIRMIHELFHAKSYQSIFTNPASGVKYASRLGLVKFQENPEGMVGAFMQLNEAVVEAMVIESYHSYFNEFGMQPLLYEEINETERMRKLLLSPNNLETMRVPDADGVMVTVTKSIITGSFLDNNVLSEVYYINPQNPRDMDGFAYRSDRRNLELLINEISTLGRYRKEQIYNIFKQASISGNYSDMRRILDETIGHGSFEKLGQSSAGSNIFGNQTWASELIQQFPQRLRSE